MAIIGIAALKVYFETGKYPTALQFGDVFDSAANLSATQPELISSRALATADPLDHTLIFDATDSTLKKALVSDFANATHTGDVTGAGALTIAPSAISGKTLATAVGADHMLIFDATDSLLKKALVSDVMGSGSSSQPYLGLGTPFLLKGVHGATSLSGFASSGPTFVGTATAASMAMTNKFTAEPKLECLVTVAATTAVAGFYYNSGTRLICAIGGPSAGLGGFIYDGIWGPATGVATATTRASFGLANTNSAPTDSEPSTSSANAVLMGWDAADINIQMMHNDATGASTKIDLGASFPRPVADRAHLYRLSLSCPAGLTQTLSYTVTDLVTAATASGTITTDLPSTSTMLMPRGYMSVGGTSSVIGMAVASIYVEPRR